MTIADFHQARNGTMDRGMPADDSPNLSHGFPRMPEDRQDEPSTRSPENASSMIDLDQDAHPRRSSARVPCEPKLDTDSR